MDANAPLTEDGATALRGWIGRTEQRDDVLVAGPVAALHATLDHDAPPPRPGDVLPPLWHWLYFLPRDRASALDVDGHALRGGFLPPVPLPRRMWAGGQLEFLRALRIGDAVTRRSTIDDVQVKHGRSGALVFVRVRHEVADAGGVAVVERQDIVYRDPPRPGTPLPAPAAEPQDEQFARRITADPVLLFRYSALTFNGHRIHYDRPHAMQVEGYPGLVVHGPLIATLLLDLLARERPAARIAAFTFKAMRPLFDGDPFTLCGRAAPDGRGFALWARDAHGALAMDAEATLAGGGPN